MERTIIKYPAIFVVIYKVITVIFLYSLGKREHSRYNIVKENVRIESGRAVLWNSNGGKMRKHFRCAAGKGSHRIRLGGAME